MKTATNHGTVWYRGQENLSSSGDACLIYALAEPAVVKHPNVSAFDDLLAEDEGSNESHEANKWVADTFYAGQPTLSSLRLRAGLSQGELGARCGLAQSHVSRYESGRTEPLLGVAMALAEALGVNLETLGQAWSNSRVANEAARLTE